MYGKLFKSVFTGSMVGSGAEVFAVWAYVIANVETNGVVELNTRLLSAVLGAPEDSIKGAVDYLLRPDPNSRNPEQEGRRLVHLGAFEYQVVSYDKYQKLQSVEDRREYQRAYWHKRKAVKQALAGIDNAQLPLNTTQQHSTESRHIDIDIEVKELSVIPPSDFADFWAHYPRKVGKAAAEKAYSKVPQSLRKSLIGALDRFKQSGQWSDPKFIPHAATWLNGRRWEDELGDPGGVEFRNGQATISGFVA